MKENRLSVSLWGLIFLVLCGCGGTPRQAALADSDAAKSTHPLILHVSPRGSGTGDGSAARPFAEIVQARDFIRGLRATEPRSVAGGVEVRIEGGTYVIGRGLSFEAEDSGSAHAPVIYCAQPSAPAVISGGPSWSLSEFQPVKDPIALQRIPEAARSAVVQIELRAQGIHDYGILPLLGHSMSSLEAKTRYRRGPVAPELFVNGHPLRLARYPNEGFTRVGKVVEVGDVIRAWMDDARGVRAMEHSWVPEDQRSDPPRGFAFQYNKEKLAAWVAAEDARMLGYWFYNWSDQSVTVSSIDIENGVIRTVEPGGYGVRQNQRFFIYNMLEELDSPGEWYLDRTSGILYLYPQNGGVDATVSLSLLSEDLVSVNQAKNIVFEGLHFSHTRERAMIVANSSAIEILDCKITNTGLEGIVIEGGFGNLVSGAEVSNTGKSGIVLSGGNVATLRPAIHVVENSLIHNFARNEKTYNPGINLSGVGQIARNNEIHSGPHVAIIFRGNDHLIEQNYIHDVVRDADDMGAIYAGRSWVSRGTVIRHNLVRNITGYAGGTHLPSAIYLDDGLSGIKVEGNIIINAALGVMLNGGRDNIVVNNLFIDSRRAVRYTSMENAYKTWAAMSYRTLWARLRAAPVNTEPWLKAYPQLVGLADGRPDLPQNSIVRDNLLFNAPWVRGIDGINPDVERLGEVRHNVETDRPPGAFDPLRRVFVFDPDSGVFDRMPALRSIPVERIGLREGRRLDGGHGMEDREAVE